MKTEVLHTEEWVLTITPEEELMWPVSVAYEGASWRYRPDRITVTVHRDLPPEVMVSGLRLRKDGTTGSMRTTWRVWEDEMPAWVADVVTKAREKHNLTAEALSRPQ